MSQEDKVKPIESPSGLDIHPKPEKPLRVSRRTGMIVAGIVLLLGLAFAYGGYKRTQKAEATAKRSGLPKSVGPASSAGNEFTKDIPPATAPMAKSSPHQLVAPASPEPTIKACGSDPKTGQSFKFDPMTGRPCSESAAASSCGNDPRTGESYRFDPKTGRSCDGVAPIERVVIRREPPPAAMHPELTPEQRRLVAAYQREQEAMAAPTGIRARAKSTTVQTPAVSEIAALGQALSKAQNSPADPTDAIAHALSSRQQNENDYEAQNAQTQKEAFLESARKQTTEVYLKSTRTAPLSDYEIKAGWEIPAVLEQALTSDLPGEIKALVTSNVYDTASGRFLLIPQGARLIGKYDSRIAYGQDGLQVAWDRLIFPDGSSVDLNGMVGLDSHGNAGLRSKVDRHYTRLFGMAALTSLFTAAFELSQRRSQSVLQYPSATDTASAAIGREMSQTGAAITRRNLNVQPTIKVPAGYKFTVRVNRDILFEGPFSSTSIY